MEATKRTWPLGRTACRQHLTDTLFLAEKRLERREASLQDLNDLQYFAQVVRHGGFSAASHATSEPKSKLSERVAQLERDLGVRLIERSADQPAYCRVVIGRSRPQRPPKRNSPDLVLAPPI
jgi:hypothetical protein